jgi:hypothetical protein
MTTGGETLYWQVRVQYSRLDGSVATVCALDLTRAALTRTILEPWKTRGPILLDGQEVQRERILQIRIGCASAPVKDMLTQEQRDAIRVASLHSPSAVQTYLASLGENVTDELLISGTASSTTPLQVVRDILLRAPEAAKLLTTPYRSGREILVIRDEYDVQNIIHAILIAVFRDTEKEVVIPGVTNIRSSRADVGIAQHGILIEVKYARLGDEKALEEQFVQDKFQYAAWNPIKHLFYVVWNSLELRQRERLRSLSKPYAVGDISFNAEVILL